MDAPSLSAAGLFVAGGADRCLFLLESTWLPLVAFAVHYLGLLAGRWYFFAGARHPQNLYKMRLLSYMQVYSTQ